MTETIKITKVDEVYMRISADRGILRELSEFFTFEVPGFRFTPAFKNTRWDGKIRVFNLQEQTLYVGLLEVVKDFARERDYDVDLDYAAFASSELSEKEAVEFVQSIIDEVQLDYFDKEPRAYQIQSFIDCVRHNRLLLQSPTSSGKSFMIYLLHRYYQATLGKIRTLIIVDGVGPVRQMAEDISSYGFPRENIHTLFGGQDIEVDLPVTVATWNTLTKLSKEFFDKFDVIIGDEAHHFQAKSFIEIMQKTTETKYKFGFTGTIDDSSKCNVMQLEGLFGPVRKFVTTSELQEQGHVADLRIKCIVLQYSDTTKKKLRKVEYQEEMDFLVSSPARNRFIKNLVLSLKGNTLLFFQYVEKHGKLLYDLIKAETDRPVFFMHGGVDGEIRNDVRAEFEKLDDAIGVVSYGTFSTAVSIKKIHNLVFASPSKSKIRNLQSIGRGLRLHDSKDYVTLIDIADNLISGSYKNYTIKHFAERVKIYDSENFKYKFYNVTLKEE